MDRIRLAFSDEHNPRIQTNVLRIFHAGERKDGKTALLFYREENKPLGVALLTKAEKAELIRVLQKEGDA